MRARIVGIAAGPLRTVAAAEGRWMPYRFAVA